MAALEPICGLLFRQARAGAGVQASGNFSATLHAQAESRINSLTDLTCTCDMKLYLHILLNMLNCMTRRILSPCRQLHPAQLAGTFSRAGHTDTQFYAACAEAALPLLLPGRLTPFVRACKPFGHHSDRACLTSFWILRSALGLLRVPACDIELAMRLSQILPHTLCDWQELAELAMACSKGHYYNVAFYDAVAAGVAAAAERFSMRDLSATAWGLGRAFQTLGLQMASPSHELAPAKSSYELAPVGSNMQTYHMKKAVRLEVLHLLT